MALSLAVSDEEVHALAPGFTHVVVEAHGLGGGPGTDASSALPDDAARRLAVRLGGRAPPEDPHMDAWREVCTAFGSRPSRTRNSAEAWANGRCRRRGCPGSACSSTSATPSASPT
jgi:DNA/RNA-binding domain of Phe-tRNA-synthetase-like protein